MKIYTFVLIFTSLFLTGCFTVPGKDRIVTVESYVNTDLCCIRPIDNPVDQVEYIPANQSFISKLNYIHNCMINYSHGQGWNDRQYFEN
jgi:hypothetical protein